ncbi:hypothetical protein E2C01_064891 [Portunus trituberculatus]|uniref:Uncharacterized protein n=1 Tax=Portunus trituberculatus TaxID=210409 RepID=A0A5B7HL25_PORTR|nr:hypothetical protein [Portunus trituberculatus]
MDSTLPAPASSTRVHEACIASRLAVRKRLSHWCILVSPRQCYQSLWGKTRPALP